MQHAIGLRVADRAQHHGFGLEGTRHTETYTLSAMANENGLILYTTDPCGFCRQAKALLESRGGSYSEINLAKDPVGRTELVALTGQLTFPQLVIGERSIGGFRELLEADRAGAVPGRLAAGVAAGR